MDIRTGYSFAPNPVWSGVSWATVGVNVLQVLKLAALAGLIRLAVIY